MHKVLPICLTLWAFLPPAAAADHQLDQALTDRYHYKILALRLPLQSNSQEYDPNGRPITVAQTGPWTVYGRVLVNKVTLDTGRLLVEGIRVAFAFDNDKKQLAPITTHQKLKVAIRLDNTLTSVEQAEAILGRVFAMTPEDVVKVAPTFWQKYLAKEQGISAKANDDNTARGSASQTQSSANSSGVLERLPNAGEETPVKLLSDSGVTPPKIRHQPSPEFSDAARKLKIEGVVGLNIVIDSTGRVRKPTIVKPMGVGLDEKAVDTVSSWLFDPARKDGRPVAVAVYVEVDYHLGSRP
jgi:TonB family protein